MNTAGTNRRGLGFFAVVFLGLAIVVAAAVIGSRGLPGLNNSPTTSVDGRNVVGKTAN